MTREMSWVGRRPGTLREVFTGVLFRSRSALNIIVFAGLGALLPAAQAPALESRLDERGLPVTTCPSAHSREPLIANRIHVQRFDRKTGEVNREHKMGDLSVLNEGRNLLLDADSYPRLPGNLVGKPEVSSEEGSYRITFELDRPDDVTLRALDAQGQVLHVLVSGVLGSNAPSPLTLDSLRQEILWDGKDSEGRPVQGVAQIEVCVGLTPRFEQFVGHDPGQLTPYLGGLTVDHDGRVYAALHTAHRYDPSILRFDREGNYVDMVYPSNPDNLTALGKTWEDVYDLVEYIDGYPVPIKPTSWRAWIEHWDDFVPLPFQIGPDGNGYMVIGMPNGSGTPLSVSARGDVERLDVIEDLDNFWFWSGKTHPGVYPTMYLQRHDAGFAFDGQGHILVAAKPHPGSHGPQPYYAFSGTIRKVDLVTGENVAAFTSGPGNSVEEPGEFLRPQWSLDKPKKSAASYIDLMQKRVIGAGKDLEPDPEYDSPDRFCDIEDLAVDAQGNILVIDGYPRRIKCYSAAGEWLGQVEGLAGDGNVRQFHDLITIEAAGEYVYLLSSFRDDRQGPVYLVKCRGTAPQLEPVWKVALDPLSRYVAVDSRATPSPLVWVANGHGPATLSRIIDQGDTAGEVRHIGGIGENTLVDPAVVCVDDRQNLYAYDKAREAILKFNAQGQKVAQLDLEENTAAHYYARYRRFPFQGKEYSAYQDGSRYFYQKVRAMVVDPERERLWVQYHASYPTHKGWMTSFGEGEAINKPWPALAAYDRDLREEQVRLFDPTGAELTEDALRGELSGLPNSIAAVDENGNLLVREGNNRRKGSGDFMGSISRLYIEGGEIDDKEEVCSLFHGSASLTVDSKGNFYTIDGPSWPETPDKWGARFDYTFPTADMTHWATRTKDGGLAYSRGRDIQKHVFETDDDKWKLENEMAEHPVLHRAEISYLVKFGPEGGERGSEQEQWALRGGFFGEVCTGCDMPLNLLTTDGADRIFVGDVDHSSVKIVDSSGNLITRFGRFGNAETLPAEDSDAKQLGFRNIYSLSAAGDSVYVNDRDLHRVAKVQMDYRESTKINIPVN